MKGKGRQLRTGGIDDNDSDGRLSYKNTEGYADPTCFFALCNVMREERKRQNRPRDAPNPHPTTGGNPSPHKPRKKRFNTQVIHFDERGKEI